MPKSKKDDLLKLPVWARDKIDTLERIAKKALEDVKALNGEHPDANIRIRSSGGGHINLPKSARLEYRLGDDWGEVLRVLVADGPRKQNSGEVLELLISAGDSRLEVHPRAANLVVISAAEEDRSAIALLMERQRAAAKVEVEAGKPGKALVDRVKKEAESDLAELEALRLGTAQLGFLKAATKSGWPDGGWTWGSYSSGLRIANSLAKRGYMERSEYNQIVLTEEGRRVVKLSRHFFERIKEAEKEEA